MNTEPFVAALAEILQAPADIVTGNYKLDSDNWDSVTVMATIALIDQQFDMTVPGRDLAGCGSVKELLELIATHKASANQS